MPRLSRPVSPSTIWSGSVPSGSVAGPARGNGRYWNALRDGLIDAVATDHAPHTREEKLKGELDAWLAPTGYPGVETMLPLLIDVA